MVYSNANTDRSIVMIRRKSSLSIGRFAVAPLAAVCALACPAATRTLKPGFAGAVDLTDGSNYEEGVAPSAGDTVVLQGWVKDKGYTHVTNSIAGDRASWELLRSLAKVEVSYGDTFALVVDGDDYAYDLPCAIYGQDDNRYVFSKLGPKRLNLTSCKVLKGTRYKDYYGLLRVEEGTLALPVNGDVDGEYAMSVRDIHVALGAMLVTAGGSKAGKPTGFATRCDGISGQGIITNEMAEAGVVYDLMATMSADATFSGAFGGPLRLRISGKAGKVLSLEAGTHTHSRQTEVGGMATLDVASLSGLGTGALGFGTGGGTFRYVGAGADAFTRRLYCTSSPGCLDGGPHGGVTFAGTLGMYSSTGRQNLFTLSGDGDTPCVFSGVVEQYTVGDAVVPIYITKRGSGTWRFLDNGKKPYGNTFYAPCGTIAVEEGTLEFDTVAGRGERCALGYATACYERVCGEPAALNAVDYAYLLGPTNAAGGATRSEGRFVYIGASSALASNRLIAVQNDAAIGVSNAKRLRWFGVRSEGIGPRTLALEACEGSTGDLYDMVDSAAAPISIEKRGAGTWRLGGRQSLHGGVSVKGGTLIVENVPNGSAYKWFRFTVKETSATCARYPALNGPDCRTVSIGEISLASADGVRRSYGLKDAPSELEIGPGTCQFGCTNMIYEPYKASSAACYFDNVKPDPKGNYGNICRVSLNVQPRLDDESTWWPAAVLRLPDGSPEIVAWDFVMTVSASASSESRAYQVTAARLEGSTDGVHWEIVGDRDDISVPTGGEYYWASTDEQWLGGNPQVRRLSDGKGWALTRTTASRETSPWEILPHVSVSPGATLRFCGARPTVMRFAVDGAAGVGTIENVSFDGGCALEISGIGDAAADVFIPFSFVNVDGLEDTSNWTFLFDGDVRGDLVVRVAEKGIRIRRTGLRVFIR